MWDNFGSASEVWSVPLFWALGSGDLQAVKRYVRMNSWGHLVFVQLLELDPSQAVIRLVW